MKLQCLFCADPLVPTLLQAERISASQIRISWEPNSRNSPLTNYTVKYYPLSQDTHLQESLLTTTEREVVVWDLEPGLRYSVSVAANNAAGRGTYTEEVTVECKCLLRLFMLPISLPSYMEFLQYLRTAFSRFFSVETLFVLNGW